VRVESRQRHRLYRRIMRVSRKFKAHDEGNVSRLGDLVRIVESRPISREKRWRVEQIIERHEVAEVQPSEIGAPEGGPQ
jgi:small subunit ribosomal protein S17